MPTGCYNIIVGEFNFKLFLAVYFEGEYNSLWGGAYGEENDVVAGYLHHL